MKQQALISQLEHYKIIYSKTIPFLFCPLKTQITGGSSDLLLLLPNDANTSDSDLNSSASLSGRCFPFKSRDGNKQKGGQRDLTGEDGSLADAGGADEEDARPRLQGSLHGLAPKPCTLTLDQKVSGFDFVAAEWEVRRRDARVTRERRKAD